MKGPRRRNPVYLLSVTLLLPFFGVMVLMMLDEIDEVNSSGCQIGISRYAASAVIMYDTFFGLFQSSMFAVYICRHIRAGVNDEGAALLRKALKVTFCGSAIALLFSMLNILSLAIWESLHSWLCFFFCICDVVVNACVCTFLLRPVSVNGKICCAKAPADAREKKSGSTVRGAATTKDTRTTEEEYEHELHAVAQLLKHMQTHGRQRELAATRSLDPVDASEMLEAGTASLDPQTPIQPQRDPSGGASPSEQSDDAPEVQSLLLERSSLGASEP